MIFTQEMNEHKKEFLRYREFENEEDLISFIIKTRMTITKMELLKRRRKQTVIVTKISQNCYLRYNTKS
jgi:hypothetical protein